MPQVRDLVDDDVAAHVRRREDQPPAEPDAPSRRAAAPAAAGIADADRARAHARRRRIFGDLARHGVEGEAVEEQLDAARETGLRPAAAQLAVGEHRRPPRALGPGNHCLAPFDRNRGARLERLERLGAGELGVDPCALLERPGQRRAPAGAPRTGQLERAARFVETQPQPLCIAHRPDFDRDRQCRLECGFRAAVRPHDIRARRHPLR